MFFFSLLRMKNKIEKSFSYLRRFYKKPSLRSWGLSCVKADSGLLCWVELSQWMIHFPFVVRLGLIHGWLLMQRQPRDVSRGHPAVNHWPVCSCGSLFFAWHQRSWLWLDSDLSDQGDGQGGLHWSSRPSISELEHLIKVMQTYSLTIASFGSGYDDDKTASCTYTLLQGPAKQQS